MALTSYRLEGNIAVIQMDDGKANALSDGMMEELGDGLTRAESEAGAVVLAGRPERFSGGFDLKVMMGGPDAARKLLRRGGELFMRFYGAPLPIVGACTGHAVAGGALRLILRPFEPEPLPVHLVYAAQSQLPLKLRAFLDFAAPRLKASLPDYL